MANIIKIKRGTGNPGSGLQAYELGWDTSTNSLYIGNGVSSTLIANAFDDNLFIDHLTGEVTIYNDLTVNGLTNLVGATTLDSTLDVTGLSSLKGGLDVTGNTTLGTVNTVVNTIRGTVNISDSTKLTTIKGLLQVDEAAEFVSAVTFDSTVEFKDDATFDEDLFVKGNTTLGDADTDSSIIRGTVTISDSTKVTNIKGTLNVDEDASFDTNITVTGNSTLGSSTTSVNTLRGTVNLSDPALITTVKGELNVDQAATFDTTVGVTGATTLHSTLDVVGDIEIGALGNPVVTINATSGDIVTSGDMFVQNLTVHGTTTTVESTVVTIADPIFTLGEDTVQDFKDRGIEFKYNDGTSAKTGFFGFDESTNSFTFIPDATNASEVFSGVFGNFTVGEIFQPLTDGVYDPAGTIVNASANWNASWVALASATTATQYDILQADADGVFQPTRAPIELTIDCGTY